MLNYINTYLKGFMFHAMRLVGLYVALFSFKSAEFALLISGGEYDGGDE